MTSDGHGKLTVSHLTLSPDSATIMSIAGAGGGAGIAGIDYDSLAVSGSSAPTFGGIMSLAFSTGTTFAVGTTFNLFTFPGTASGDMQSILTLASGSSPYRGLSFTAVGSGIWVSDTTTERQFLRFSTATGQLVVVPEPSAFALAAIGCVVAVEYRRRLRSSKEKKKRTVNGTFAGIFAVTSD